MIIPTQAEEPRAREIPGRSTRLHPDRAVAGRGLAWAVAGREPVTHGGPEEHDGEREIHGTSGGSWRAPGGFRARRRGWAPHWSWSVWRSPRSGTGSSSASPPRSPRDPCSASSGARRRSRSRRSCRGLARPPVLPGPARRVGRRDGPRAPDAPPARGAARAPAPRPVEPEPGRPSSQPSRSRPPPRWRGSTSWRTGRALPTFEAPTRRPTPRGTRGPGRPPAMHRAHPERRAGRRHQAHAHAGQRRGRPACRSGTSGSTEAALSFTPRHLAHGGRMPPTSAAFLGVGLGLLLRARLLAVDARATVVPGARCRTRPRAPRRGGGRAGRGHARGPSLGVARGDPRRPCRSVEPRQGAGVPAPRAGGPPPSARAQRRSSFSWRSESRWSSAEHALRVAFRHDAWARGARRLPAVRRARIAGTPSASSSASSRSRSPAGVYRIAILGDSLSDQRAAGPTASGT